MTWNYGPVVIWHFSSRRTLRVSAVGLLMLSFLAGPLVPIICADDARVFEFEIKAAMVYKFLGYIEWPETAFRSPEAPYVIAVVGAAAVAAELRRIAQDGRVNDRSVEVIEVSDPEDLAGVHILFVGHNVDIRETKMVHMAQQYSVVTVTEYQDGLDPSSVINLRVANGRIQFDVSLKATEKRNIKLSARMLAVASSVKTGNH